MATYWHGSPYNIDGKIEARRTLEFGDNKKYVFAIRNKLIALMFLDRKEKSGYASWMISDGKIIITEQYKNDLEHRYLNSKGYLYRITDRNKCFHKHPESLFKYEYVCENDVEFNEKIFVNDVLREIKKYVMVVRYEKISKFMNDLCLNNEIELMDKFVDEHSEKCKKKDCVLFKGKFFMYTTLVQAILSFMQYESQIVPVCIKDKVTLFCYTKKIPFADIKYIPKKINIYGLKGAEKLYHNIYMKSERSKLIKTIKVPYNRFNNIYENMCDKIYFAKTLDKFMEKIKTI